MKESGWTVLPRGINKASILQKGVCNVQEDEIPKTLEEGSVYTERQVKSYLKEHKDSFVLSELRELDSFGAISNVTRRVKVISIREQYVHRYGSGFNGYLVPNEKTTLIEIESTY
ncbi:hypothetical protein NIE88_18795 [Sporolactobacillus shoreicorticis]|uniref:Uncharacterized protein n=1 Tax=Sporolactobacillus shoreicorticis TaxID=1923877 RepID=A0ABW5S8Y3_9BACL|nr:hypothetical protein [Sporolactobacillus shoreicorticis]MCO7127798.1 hypothetical protein [Sporolactobacillus shoreicorticis]